MPPATDSKIQLPLLSPQEPPRQWEQWTPLGDAPEPVFPQGAYLSGDSEIEASIPVIGVESTQQVELLAPAGGLDAGFAAFHYGADAIYLGLKKFSARAEAENFTFEEVDEITAYAHSLTPRRRVFVTINTLIRQDELAELVEVVAKLDQFGVDALIIQDLGVYHLVRKYFPRIELHASTQLAVHNRAGAETLKQMGFHRVVLARELTFEEVRDITSTSDIETEVFIHGALCYSYSGLCLFSSQTLGRSGNRGKCAYSCRDSYEVQGAPLTLRDGAEVKRDPRQGFPFSMKDLALPDHIPALRAAGVSCFKVEGRKKSPLYVATTTEYYRKLIDGTLADEERPALEADMQTVFSRPWTKLFLASHKDKEVADRDTVGHRGALIGQVEKIHNHRLRFRARRAIQKHDGLQIDLPVLGKPFGFAVDKLWVIEKRDARRDVFEAPAGCVIEVSLPKDAPEIPQGAPVYCSSSQAVKNHYRHERPKPGLYRRQHAIDIASTMSGSSVTIRALVPELEIEVSETLAGPFESAHDAAGMERAARTTFEKLGGTQFRLSNLHWQADAFIPVSRLNQARRRIVEQLDTAIGEHLAAKVRSVQQSVCPVVQSPANAAFRWSLKVDRLAFLEAFEDADWTDVEEVVIDIARDHPALLVERVGQLGGQLGRERIRLALPPITRFWEEKNFRHKIEQLRKAGFMKWEVANLAGWAHLGMSPCARETVSDVASDWSLYVVNRLAARQLVDMGITRCALSPEDGLENMRSLLAEFAEQAVVIVYQDTPQFIAESCAYANLIGGCPGKANCKFESMQMVSSHGEKVTALDYHCRTIVLNEGPFSLSTRLPELKKAGAVHLRADFVYRPYESDQVRDIWRSVRAGKRIANSHFANFDRGIL